jgi:hypothetical protein
MLAAAIALSASFVFAQAQGVQSCSSVPFTVSVIPAVPGEHIDRNYDSRSLAAKLGVAPLPGFRAQGLTNYTYSSSFNTNYESVQMDDGSWCSRVRSIDVTFGFAEPPTIYISSELTSGSCLYNAVLRHEYVHMGIGHETIATGRKAIPATVQATLSKASAAVAASPEVAMALVGDRIAAVVKQTTEQLYAVSKARNMFLDTPENYARLGSECH